MKEVTNSVLKQIACIDCDSELAITTQNTAHCTCNLHYALIKNYEGELSVFIITKKGKLIQTAIWSHRTHEWYVTMSYVLLKISEAFSKSEKRE